MSRTTKTKTNEDQHLLDEIQRLLGDTARVDRFEVSLLAANGVSAIHQAEVVSIGGVDVLLVQASVSHRYLNLGSGSFTSRSAVAYEWAAFTRTGYRRVRPHKAWELVAHWVGPREARRPVGRWTRKWEVCHTYSWRPSRQLLLDALTVPESKWDKAVRGKYGELPTEVRTRRPKGELSSSGRLVKTR